MKKVITLALVAIFAQLSISRTAMADTLCWGIPFVYEYKIIGDSDSSWLTYADVFGNDFHFDFGMNPIYDQVCAKNHTSVPMSYLTSKGDEFVVQPGETAQFPYAFGEISVDFTNNPGQPEDELEIQMLSSDGTFIYRLTPPTSDADGTFHANMMNPMGVETNLIALATDGEIEFIAYTLTNAHVSAFFSADINAGDVNKDGVVNLLDVEPFVELLSTGGFQEEADINMDGSVNLLDVEPFVAILSGG